MKKIIAVGIIVVLSLNVAIMLVGFSYLGNEINQMKLGQAEPETTPEPEPESPQSDPPETSTQPEQPPQETTSESTIPEPDREYEYVVYEWHLKSGYINNVTWLKRKLSTSYDPEETWNENYISYLKRQYAIPEQIANSEIGVLAKNAFVYRHVFVSASFSEETGYTKAVYKYYDDGGPLLYGIESFLPIIADDRGWTKQFTDSFETDTENQTGGEVDELQTDSFENETKPLEDQKPEFVAPEVELTVNFSKG